MAVQLPNESLSVLRLRRDSLKEKCWSTITMSNEYTTQAVGAQVFRP